MNIDQITTIPKQQSWVDTALAPCDTFVIIQMNKNKTLYFRKIHKLFINSIVVRSSYHFHYSSTSFAEAEDIISTNAIQPNKTIDITTIDTLEKGNQAIDSEVTLDVHTINNNIKHLVGRVSFDLKREKILNPNSSQFYKKAIKKGDGMIDGYIQYKFVALNTSEISEQTYKESQNHKNDIEIEEKSLEVSQEYRKLLEIVSQKDSVISNMENQIHKLMDETRRLSSNVRDQEIRQSTIKNPISLSINMKPSNKTENEHKRLIKENQALKAKMFKMSEIIEKIERQKRIMQEEIQYWREAVEISKKSSLDNEKALLNLEEKKAQIEEFKKSYLNTSMQKDQQAESVNLAKQSEMLEYSSIKSRLNKEAEELKNQIRTVSSGNMNELNMEKDLLMEKLRNSIKEIDLLKDEIENMHVYIKKLTDELKILRKNNSSDGIMAKIEAIRSENEKMIEDLKKQGNISAQELLFAYRRENYLIEIQMLKKENEELKTHVAVQQAQANKKYKEEEMKLYLLQSKLAEVSRDKDMFKVQLDEAKSSLERYLSTPVTSQNIGTTAEDLTRQLTAVMRKNDILEKNIANQKASFQQLREKYEQTVKELKLKTDDMVKLTKVESANMIASQKLVNYEAEIQKFQKKYNDLKNFALKIQNAFQSKRKFASQQHYEEEMVQKLKSFENMAKQSEKEYINAQLDLIKEEKALIIEAYYNEIKREYEKIQANAQIQPQQKKILKVAKEQQLSKEKDEKLQSLEKKIKQLQAKRQEIEKPIIRLVSVPQRMNNLQKLLTDKSKHASLMLQSKQLRQSIMKMRESQENKKIESDKLKESNSKFSGSGVFSGIQGAYAESRMKYMEEFQRIIEDTKKKLHAATKENQDLKIKNSVLQGAIQKQKIEVQRQKKTMTFENQEKERLREIQKIGKEKELQFKVKTLETSTAEIAKLKQEKNQLQICCNMLEEELKKISRENDMRIQENIELTKEVERYRADLDETNNGVSVLMKSIEQMKKEQETKVSTLQALMQERSETFVKLAKVKDTQISQLKRLLQECQTRAESETYETIKLKESLITITQQLETALKDKNGLESALTMEQENYKKEKSDYEERIVDIEEKNHILQNNLMAIAEQFDQMQENLAIAKIKIESLEKEKDVYKGLEAKIAEVQSSKTRDKQEMTYVILDKKEQLRKYQTQLLILQEKMKMVSEENQRIRLETNKYKDQSEHLKEKINQKNLDIIQLSQQKSLINIEKARRQSEIQDLIKKLKTEQGVAKELRAQLDRIQEELELERQSKDKQGRPKNSEARRSPRLSRQASMEEMQHQSDKKSRSQEKPKPSVEIQVIENIQSLHHIEESQEDNGPHQQQQHQQQLGDNLDNKSVHSERSHRTRKSSLSRKHRQNNAFYLNSTPQMFEHTNNYQQRQEQLLKILNETETERDELRVALAQFKLEMERIKCSSEKKGSENIKIDDSGSHVENNSGNFSLGNKINFFDSRELNNTNQGTDKEHSKDHRDLELMMEEMERQCKTLKQELNEQRLNVQNLIKCAEEEKNYREELLAQIEELKKQCEEKCAYVNQVTREYEGKMEETISEMMEKENNLTNTLKELEDHREHNQRLQQQISHLQMELDQKNKMVEELAQKIKRIKSEYRKYEEQAQLEILSLKERFDQAKSMSTQKNDDIQEIAHRYLELEKVNAELEGKLRQLKMQLEQSNSLNQRLQEDNDKIGKERQDFTQNRKKGARRAHELEVQLLTLNEKLMQANKCINLTLTKANIKTEGMEEQLADARNRIDDKEKVILTLKNQIALYNQECMELKRANQDLDYEIQRVTKELKDIMVNYELQFETLSKNKHSMLEKVQSYEALLKEKQHKMAQIRMEMRQSERQRIKAESELKEIKEQFERFKNVKNRQYNDKCKEFQLKNNEVQVLKATHAKLTEENYSLQSQLEQERRKYKIFNDQYRQKMARYEDSLEQVCKQMVLLADRPTKQAWQQAIFENQLYRNRIAELQAETKKKGSSNDDLVTIQFRKFKARSQIVIRNLQQEMQGYSQKINQLQEASFYMKKENDSLRGQLMKVTQGKYQLQEEIKNLQEDIEDLREEVEFYKSKRRQELTKLMNDTDD